MTHTLTDAQKKELDGLYEELRQLKAGTHPKLLEEWAKIAEAEKWHRELDAIDEERSAESLAQLKVECDRRLKEVDDEMERLVAELVTDLLNDYDKELRKVDNYVMNLDITRPHVEPPPPEVNKKALRQGTGPSPFAFGFTSSAIGRKFSENTPTTSSRGVLPPPVPLMSILPPFLLKESEIAEDLRAIGYDGKGSPVKNITRNIEAGFTKHKFSYDGKTYKVGEEVFVENREYGKIPAKIESITEEVVSFKSSYLWDVRQIYASYSDFQEGRVVVHKKR